MTKPHCRRDRFAAALVVLFLWLGSAWALNAQPATGTIEGRISNPAGKNLERARITVEGTTLETFSDSDGNYRLTNVPPGAARVSAFFTGLQRQTNSVNVPADGTAQLDIQLSATSSAPSLPDGAPIKLDEFVVGASREMSGAALAINEQRFAPNMKNVVSADE